jgi:hypothetical protein
MYFDLNVPVVVPTTARSGQGKGKQKQPNNSAVVYTAAQILAIEARIDLLVQREFPLP